jgi:adenylate kinase family enzyme
MDQQVLQRIAVVGTCGAGKTRLAASIGSILKIRHFELDNLHWTKDWMPVDDESFCNRVHEICAQETWITDGNYGKVRDRVFARVQTVVWLDYPFWVIFSRLLWRTLLSTLTQEELVHGNKENWQQTFFSRKSILWWAIKTHGRRRREYDHLSRSQKYAHIQFLRFRDPRQTEVWLTAMMRDQPKSA